MFTGNIFFIVTVLTVHAISKNLILFIFVLRLTWSAAKMNMCARLTLFTTLLNYKNKHTNLLVSFLCYNYDIKSYIKLCVLFFYTLFHTKSRISRVVVKWCCILYGIKESYLECAGNVVNQSKLWRLMNQACNLI